MSNEAALVDAIEAEFRPWARKTAREVAAVWPAGGSEHRPKGRIDLVVWTPRDWRFFRHFPVIAIEAKDDAGWQEINTGIEQTKSAMSATEIATSDGPEVRPSIALLVSRHSWETGWTLTRPGDRPPDCDPLTAFVERHLWRAGCAVLFGPQPFFNTIAHGLKQERVRCWSHQ